MIQSARFRVRPIHQLYITPATSPTSQYGPCSVANKMAVTQNGIPECVPNGTFVKSELIRYRINHPRQNSSSMIGTRTAVPKIRNARNVCEDRNSGPSELVAEPNN